MGELTMSAKELLFAGAQLGANTFYGLPDSFYGMTWEQIHGEVPRLQSSLEQRGCANMGFDGSFTLKEDVKSLVEPCANCRQYLLVRATAPGGAERLVLVYAGENGVVEVETAGEDVTLRPLGLEDVTGRILREIVPAVDKADGGTASGVTIRRADLAEVQPKAIEDPQGAKEALLSLHCGPETAELLVQGFRREAGFHVLIRADLDKRTLEQAMAIQSEAGAVWLTLEDLDEDIWRADYLPGGVNAAALETLCQMKGAAHEVL